MLMIPAIDIKDGNVVRLMQGKFDQVTQYSDQPAAVAQRWADDGAQLLHLVDLDGAQNGRICNLHVITQIAHAVNIPVQVGGGIRSKEDILNLLEAGVSRVILGTKAIEDQEFLKEILALWPDQVAVSLDCKNGKVAQHGWASVSKLNAFDFAKELELLGVKMLVYTDIQRDGMLSGPDFEGLRTLLKTVQIPIIASGGISNLEDIQCLLGLEAGNLYGTITGKAIYEGTLDLKKAIALCSQNA